jgi:FkbM family methyltransferase
VNKADLIRFPSKRDGLRVLRHLGIDFGCVVDVGVQASTDELIEVFPDLPHYLFEPVSQYEGAMRERYKNIKHEIFQVAVSDADGMAKLTTKSIDGSGHITHSHVSFSGSPVPTANALDTLDIPTVRLSSIIMERAFPTPILLKIDVDGHELPIINGLKGAEHTVGCVVVEAPLAMLAARCAALESLGFVLWDVNDMWYYKGCLLQVDLIFLSAEFSALPQIRPLHTDGKIDWSAWHTISSSSPV